MLRGICSNLALVRADVSRLPFASGSIDAVHAGAALHCWPSPSNAVSSFTGFVSFSDFFYLLGSEITSICTLHGLGIDRTHLPKRKMEKDVNITEVKYNRKGTP